MKQKEKLDTLGKKILNVSRTDLLLNLPYLNTSLLSLDYVLDLTTTSIGTDAFSIRFHPHYLFRLYQDAPVMVNRTYLHMLMHCLFRHVFSATRFPEERLFNLACDIAVEHILDSMDEPAIHRPLTDLREDIYVQLEKKIGVFTAEKIYHYLLSSQHFILLIEKWEKTFLADDHSFWKREREDGDQKPPDKETSVPALPLMNAEMRQVKEEEWDRISKRVQSEIDLLSGHDSGETGALSWMLSLQNDRYQDFRQYLSKFAVVREEIGIDPDSFDLGLYNYGMEIYGNMPLIEENELRTTKKISSLVIAIDTSASCKERLVKKFLSQTAAILKAGETFFHHVELCILECDNVIQNEIFISDLREIDDYTTHFTAHGGYGTDFRPVFERVADLQTKGKLVNLRGLLYFTDGFGTFPQSTFSNHSFRTRMVSSGRSDLHIASDTSPYETAFVFYKDAPYNEKDVPPWAVKLFFSETV